MKRRRIDRDRRPGRANRPPPSNRLGVIALACAVTLPAMVNGQPPPSITSSRSTYAKSQPIRLPAVVRPTRMPPVKRSPQPAWPPPAWPPPASSQSALSQSALTQPALSQNVGDDDVAGNWTVNLLAPRVARRERPPETSLDLFRFDASIESSLASFGSLAAIGNRDAYSPADAASESCYTDRYADDFSPTFVDDEAMYFDSGREQWVYDAKYDVPTQHPWIEWGRRYYEDGIMPRGLNLWGKKNLVRPKFYLYGDFRTGFATGRNAAGRTDNWANRLNLDLDLQLTDTERFHAFVGPLDSGNQFTRWESVNGDLQFRNEIDFTPLTGFFEGDLGVLLGTAFGQTSPFELPFTIGLVPLLFQNGIWMEDAVTGAAFSLPAKHSRLLNWSNFDATFFAIADQINSAAFGSDEHAAQAIGTAWFIEAYGGYIESGYAYVRDRNFKERSYHNITASFTRRYFDRISNSVRVIVNTGQDLPSSQRTADGVLLLVENSWITASPLTVVPYANFFIGWDRPQSVARAAASGGILRNTGINFDTDGLSGFATLDPTARDTAGGTLGIDLLGQDLDRQLLLELAYLTPHRNNNPGVPDDQFAAGTRYQFPISNSTLLRFDLMYGWRRGLEDVYGTRMEYRWKF